MRSKLATWRPVPYKGLQRRLGRAAAVIHTNGGGDRDIPDDLSLYGWFTSLARQGKTIGTHFQVMTSGKIEQYVDTAYSIGHAYAANSFTVGIEVEDDGMPSLPFFPRQIDSILALLRELKVPARLLAATPSDGLGWHQLYPSWNQSGHGCPGSVRVSQIRNVILPRLRGDDMALRDELAKIVGVDAANLDEFLQTMAGVWDGIRGRDSDPTDPERLEGFEFAKKAVLPGGIVDMNLVADAVAAKLKIVKA